MQQDGAVFAGYRIERLLGQGGMGAVYLARHPRLPRSTALKLLNQELFSDAEIRARFEREADLVAQLDHPNIVTVYDRGVEEDQLWISMQYIDGIDVESVEPRAIHPLRVVQIIGETAKALDFAHSSGVLHRDVKPANILLARTTAGQERVYLTDFGIARLRDDAGHLTQTGSFTATVAYAAPEQLTGAPMDGRSDQYSLACTLYWLLTGATPFQSPLVVDVIRGHLQLQPPRLTALRPELPQAVDAAVGRAMSKRLEERFDSCTDFVAAVGRALAPSSARPMPVQPPAPTPAAPMPVAPPPHAQPAGYPAPAIPATSAPQPYRTPQGYPGPVAPAPYQRSTPTGVPGYVPPPASPQPYGYQPPPQQGSMWKPVLLIGGVLLLLMVIAVIVRIVGM